MNIVLLVRSLGIGGAERQVLVLAHALACEHEVTVVTFYDDGAPVLSREDLGCPVHSLAKQGRWDVIGFAWRYLCLMARLKPDLVYAFLPTATLVSLLSRLVHAKVALVWGMRASKINYRYYDRLSAFARAAEIRLARFANLLIANSSRGRLDAIAEGVVDSDIIVIGNGIDVERYKPSPEARARIRAQLELADDDLLIGMVARLDPMKGHEVFLSAASQLVRSEERVRFVCIGSGSAAYSAALRDKARRLELENKIAWLAADANIENYYPAMDIHTSASLFGEGFSNALGEAMASGVPCVATAVGEAVVIVGDTGIVVAPASADELAAGLSRLIAQIRSEGGELLGQQARARIVACYGVERLVEETTQALLGVLERAVRARPDDAGTIRIAHIISDLDIGGAERMLVRIVNGLRNRYPQIVICMTDGGPLVDQILDVGVPVVTLNMPRGRPTLRGWLRARRALRQFRPSLVQTWLYHADLLGTLLVPRSARAKLVWNLRCADMQLGEYRRLTGLVRKILVWFSARPVAVLANSQVAVDAHIGLGYHARRWIVIPNGFDLTRFRPDPAAPQRLRATLNLPSGARLIGMIARRDPAKDHATLLAAVRLIVSARDDVWFYLVGADIDTLAGDLALLGLESRVILSASRLDVETIYPGLDVAVLSSSFGEAFPNVLGEAMACATPCVTTDIGEARAIVGDTGMVVPRRDPGALAAALLDVLDWNSAERAARGAAARERIARMFDLDQCVEQYANVYRELSTACAE